MPELSEIIKNLFEEKKVSPAEVSRRSGVPAAQISQIINGVTKNPTWKTMIQLAGALNEPISVFAISDTIVAEQQHPFAPQPLPAEERDLLRRFRKLDDKHRLQLLEMAELYEGFCKKSGGRDEKGNDLKVSNSS